MPPRLRIIIVNWNSGPLLAENLRSLRARNDLTETEVVVVDNDSRDGSADIARELAWVRTVFLDNNVGFAAAANLGADGAHADWLLFLNPDIVHTPVNVESLHEDLSRMPSAGGGCGKLVDSAGLPELDFQLRRLPGPAWALAELFLPPALRRWSGLSRRHFYLGRDRSRPFPVEQPAAACLMLRREVFEEAGGFDAGFKPAWFEDVDLAFRLRRAGHRLWFCPRAVFIHRGGYSAETLGRMAFLEIYWRNAIRYYKKNFPLFGRIYHRLFPVAASVRELGAWGRPEERSAWRRLRQESLREWRQ